MGVLYDSNHFNAKMSWLWRPDGCRTHKQLYITSAPYPVWENLRGMKERQSLGLFISWLDRLAAQTCFLKILFFGVGGRTDNVVKRANTIQSNINRILSWDWVGLGGWIEANSVRLNRAWQKMIHKSACKILFYKIYNYYDIRADYVVNSMFSVCLANTIWNIFNKVTCMINYFILCLSQLF